MFSSETKRAIILLTCHIPVQQFLSLTIVFTVSTLHKSTLKKTFLVNVYIHLVIIST